VWRHGQIVIPGHVSGELAQRRRGIGCPSRDVLVRATLKLGMLVLAGKRRHVMLENVRERRHNGGHPGGQLGVGGQSFPTGPLFIDVVRHDEKLEFLALSAVPSLVVRAHPR
jgi:hypothetical protein